VCYFNLDVVPIVPFGTTNDEHSPSGSIIRNCFGIIKKNTFN